MGVDRARRVRVDGCGRSQLGFQLVDPPASGPQLNGLARRRSRSPAVVHVVLPHPLRQRDGMDAELDRGLLGLLAGADQRDGTRPGLRRIGTRRDCQPFLKDWQSATTLSGTSTWGRSSCHHTVHQSRLTAGHRRPLPLHPPRPRHTLLRHPRPRPAPLPPPEPPRRGYGSPRCHGSRRASPRLPPTGA